MTWNFSVPGERTRYYEEAKRLARQMRAESNIHSPRVLLSDMRRIYRRLGIHIDMWPKPHVPRAQSKLRKLRGAFFGADEYGQCSVMLDRYLPQEPRIFTMAHELKHFIMDTDGIPSFCDASNYRDPREIAAEVYAAELIFPDADFTASMSELEIGPGGCQPEDIVHLKHRTETTLSYQALAKKAEWLGFAPDESLKKIKWRKLDESIYGEPVYKRVLRARRARSPGSSPEPCK